MPCCWLVTSEKAAVSLSIDIPRSGYRGRPAKVVALCRTWRLVWLRYACSQVIIKECCQISKVGISGLVDN